MKLSSILTRWYCLALLLLWSQLTFGFYDPSAQRWINRDPIEERDGINLHRFCRNSPLKYIDPSGLQLLPFLPKPWGAQPVGGKYIFGPCTFISSFPVEGTSTTACTWNCFGWHYQDEIGHTVSVVTMSPPCGPCPPPSGARPGTGPGIPPPIYE